MEAVLFIGIQATGKSSFYLERFFRTHVRINGDMLKTRHREELLINACLQGRTDYVVDRMNLTRTGRAAYIARAKAAGFTVSGYWFESDLAAALQRNARRDPVEHIPEPGLRLARKTLEPPSLDEGFDCLYRVRMDGKGGFLVEQSTVQSPDLNPAQAAAAAQFSKQSDRYGKSHILADTQDVAAALTGVSVPAGGTALDVATGGGHTALFLARQGWKVTAGDVSPRMLENARNLCAQEGFSIETRLFPAEAIPFPDANFDLLSSRVAPHHFSSPEQFVREAARVLKPGGHFVLIDGTVPDDDPDTEAWLHQVEKWRDPSHGRFLSRRSWEDLVREAGLQVIRSELSLRKQPDLEWYFETAATTAVNREKVLEAVRTAPGSVRTALRLGLEQDKIIWWWPILTLLARKS